MLFKDIRARTLMLFRDAMDAAAFALTQVEANLDRIIGREARLAFGRYLAVVVIGVPIAWAFTGFHWETTSTYGLIAGLVLYALVDIVRTLTRSKDNSRK
jgi:hypothetical protein